MLIAMAVHDTEENGRTELTRRTLESLTETVDWSRHRLIISDNGSCEETQRLYKLYGPRISAGVIRNGENIGTANAINRAWLYKRAGEHVVKMDNDVVFHVPGWADKMAEALDRDRNLAIIGLKRKDLAERPDSASSWYKSTLKMLPHEAGESWIVVEAVNHVMGTCTAYQSEFVDNVFGFLWQPGPYGFDDSLACLRAKLAGFYVAFLCNYDIDHIDPGRTSYTDWKRLEAGERMAEYNRAKVEYRSGDRPIFYDGGKMLREYLEREAGHQMVYGLPMGASKEWLRRHADG